MRCPECSQRNSVAAKKCAACGSALRRKPISLSVKIFVGTLVGLIFIFCLAALSTTLVNTDKALSNAALLLTSKSTSADSMMVNYKHFDQTMRAFLQKYGSLSSDELTNKLSTCLPKSLYEDHVFDLLPNLKLVEIDTALNASNYLVLLTNGKAEVLPIIGLDVYDTNSFLPQSNKTADGKKASEGQLLVLLGHTANIHGHQPRVKVLLLSSTLQSDNIIDLTDTAVPKLYGEGNAKFAPNQKDIELSTSLFSRGQELQLFSPQEIKSSLPVDNELLYEQLFWQNNCYTIHSQPGTSKLFALYAAASTLKNHNKIPRFHSYLSNTARQTIEQAPIITNDQGFTIKAYRGGKKAATTGNIYELRDNSTRIIVELKPTSRKVGGQTSWFVNSLSIAHAAPPVPSVALAATTKQTKPEASKSAVVEKPRTTEAKLPENKLPKPTPAQVQTHPLAISEMPTLPAPKAKEAAQKIKETSKSQNQATFVPGLTSYVKMRSGPNTSYQSVQELDPKAAITIIGKENGWYKVKIANKEGYVYGGLVNNHKSGGYINKTIKQASTVKDDQQHTIDNINTGDHLILLSGLKNNRYKVMLSNGKTGYVSKEAVDGGHSSHHHAGIASTPPPSVP